MEREQLRRSIADWREKLDAASGARGGVTICAATKTIDPEIINWLVPEGVVVIGENRVQELLQKLPALNPAFSIHLIGQLQSNKVKYIVQSVNMIQSVDRLPLAEEISRRALDAGRVMDILIEVNIAQEAQKAGVDEDELERLLRAVAPLEGVCVRGLMAMAPLADDPELARPYFRRMRMWFERIREMDIPRVEMEILSMGMSGDCLVAAEEGATMVRLGSALFRSRS